MRQTAPELSTQIEAFRRATSVYVPAGREPRSIVCTVSPDDASARAAMARYVALVENADLPRPSTSRGRRVFVELAPEAAARFLDATARAVRHRLAIVVDGVVVSAPLVMSPISGGRYRFEVSPTFGNRTFTAALADYRRYHFKRPVTFAWRAMHYGYYGKDAENWRDQFSWPLFLGEEQMVRGYSYESFSADECAPPGSNVTGCPVFDRLIGSRLAVFNAELRVPLVGSRDFGLINLPFIPVEMAPFFDAGLMWTSDQAPQLRIADEANATPTTCNARSIANGICAERIPVFSAGVTFRFNVLGYLILETYLAKPFQRPQKDWVWGLQLMPGW